MESGTKSNHNFWRKTASLVKYQSGGIMDNFLGVRKVHSTLVHLNRYNGNDDDDTKTNNNTNK